MLGNIFRLKGAGGPSAGTNYTVTYFKREGSPGLLAKDRVDKDNPRQSLTIQLLAHPPHLKKDLINLLFAASQPSSLHEAPFRVRAQRCNALWLYIR
jgi:hypothetical protein